MQDNMFGSYRVLNKIARGAFSEIFSVELEGKKYALKKLHPYLMYDYEYAALLKTEALLLRKISDFSHFPRLYDSGKVGHEHYLILELIEGLNLEEAIAQSFQKEIVLGPHKACQVALEISKGLEHLHQTEIDRVKQTVHGDLRASNVMVGHRGEVKMIDLGLKGGTFDYMPLERLHDKIITPYTDLYATGHILFEMLHGRRLFKGKTKLEAYFEMREVQINEEIFDDRLPPAVRSILVKCLNQDPGIRYKNLFEFREDLENYLRKDSSDRKENELGDWILRLKEIQS